MKVYRIRKSAFNCMLIIMAMLLIACATLTTALIVVKNRTPKEVVVEVVTEVVTPSGQAKYTLILDDYSGSFTRQDVEDMGRAIWGEAGGISSKTERAAVGWVILNQVDSNANGMRNYHNVQDVLAKKTNIQGYWAKINAGEVPEQYLSLAYDILCRYYAEKDGWTNVGRIIPSDYLYWMGDGHRNYFTIGYHSGSMNYCYDNAWDWSLASPYAN